ncbi:glycine--tRNA ligase subunit beta [Atopobacter phocae]|uniref:glycine--tRNA ligase subunit beta n=1 Tax=Atopobacter phocae TaxID=136492 RepID=UPI000472A374|nr:glycine--tRNA ligase subunit beta [Atopobacter phocae]
MNNFLIELGLEEMPARTIIPAMNDLKAGVAQFLNDERLSFEAIKVYSTPRRLAVLVSGLADRQTTLEQISRGPAKKNAVDEAGQWTKAAIGFSRGKGADLADLYIDQVKDVEYVFLKQVIEGKPAQDVLQSIGTVFESLNFPVSMRWSDYDYQYIRPVHWIVSLLNEEIVPVQIFNLTGSNQSRGHRFLGESFQVNSAVSYVDQLKEQYVIVDLDQRREMIKEQMRDLEATQQIVIAKDDELLEEVASIVEYPSILMGDFDPKYLAIPDEILITTMKGHQRYFDVHTPAGKLLPHFVTVRNGDNKHIENVKKGNEKVLVARLEDALFFYEEDQKQTIDTFNQRLAHLNVHQKVGTMAEKEQRVITIGQHLGQLVGLSADELAQLKRASAIYKFDLTTQTVQELPELQGIIGGIYAKLMGESDEVATAVREQYLPDGAGSLLPSSAIASVLALSDKIDHLLAFFKVGLIPTSSNDPFGLRRQAIGIIQIIKNENWTLNWEQVLNEFIGLYDGIKRDEQSTIALVIQFMKDRLAQGLLREGFRDDIVKAALGNQLFDFNRIQDVTNQLMIASQDESYKATIENLSRVLRMQKDQTTDGQIDEAHFETASEKELYHHVLNWKETLKQRSISYDDLKTIAPKIEQFFNDNMIMVDDETTRNNRLTLLGQLANYIMTFADVTELQVKR